MVTKARLVIALDLCDLRDNQLITKVTINNKNIVVEALDISENGKPVSVYETIPIKGQTDEDVVNLG